MSVVGTGSLTPNCSLIWYDIHHVLEVLSRLPAVSETLDSWRRSSAHRAGRRQWTPDCALYVQSLEEPVLRG
jgi:hypothetical protein